MEPANRTLPDGLRLVPIAAEHADTVVQWRMDRDSRSMFLQGQTITVASQLAWTARASADISDLTCIALHDGVPVGMVALYGMANGQAEFGRILVDKERRRRGIGRAIGGLIIAHGFARLGLHRIQADCLAMNHPGQRLLAAVGFARADVWHHVASGRDVVRLCLHRQTWSQMPTRALFERGLAEGLATIGAPH